MKKISAGFLAFACLTLSVRFGLPLLQEIFDKNSFSVDSESGQISKTNVESFSKTKLVAKNKVLRRPLYTHDANFVFKVKEFSFSGSCVGFLVCCLILFFSICSFFVHLRSPPAAFRF